MRNGFLFMGRLTIEPKIGEKVTRFGIAVDRRYRADGEEKPGTDFFQVLAFGRTKDFVDKYLKKGMKVQVTGTIRNDNYEKDGSTVYQNSFIANEIEFCEKKGRGSDSDAADDGEVKDINGEE